MLRSYIITIINIPVVPIGKHRHSYPCIRCGLHFDLLSFGHLGGSIRRFVSHRGHYFISIYLILWSRDCILIPQAIIYYYYYGLYLFFISYTGGLLRRKEQYWIIWYRPITDSNLNCFILPRNVATLGVCTTYYRSVMNRRLFRLKIAEDYHYNNQQQPPVSPLLLLFILFFDDTFLVLTPLCIKNIKHLVPVTRISLGICRYINI